MQFSRLISFFAVFITLAVFALATPSKRQSTAEAQNILNTLQTNIAPTLASINSSANAGDTSSSTITPLINSLETELSNAATSLSAVNGGGGLLRRVLVDRQTENDVADTTANIVSNIGFTLNHLKGRDPAVAVLLGSVDVALHKVLVALDILVAGVLKLVAGLLVGVAGLLDGLAFGLSLGLLGL